MNPDISSKMNIVLLSIFLCMILPLNASLAQGWNAEHLKEFEAVKVEVETEVEGTNSLFMSLFTSISGIGSIEERINASIEKALREAVIPVHTQTSWSQDPLRPSLLINVKSFTTSYTSSCNCYNGYVSTEESDLYIYTTSLELVQTTTDSNGNPLRAVTYEAGGYYGSTGSGGDIQRAIMESVRTFISDWHKAHPGAPRNLQEKGAQMISEVSKSFRDIGGLGKVNTLEYQQTAVLSATGDKTVSSITRAGNDKIHVESNLGDLGSFAYKIDGPAAYTRSIGEAGLRRAGQREEASIRKTLYEDLMLLMTRIATDTNIAVNPLSPLDENGVTYERLQARVDATNLILFLEKDNLQLKRAVFPDFDKEYVIDELQTVDGVTLPKSVRVIIDGKVVESLTYDAFQINKPLQYSDFSSDQ